jgi:eukaryotic translation initiation factor 2C
VIENTLFSKPVGRETYLGNGVEVWIGHNQVFSMETNPYAVVSISPWAFLKSDKVHKIMSEIYGTRIGERLDGSDLADFQVKITDLEVSYSNGQCEVTVGCNGIKGPANVEKLVCDGNIVTLQEYFEKILDTKLQYPNLPCVWVGSRDKNNLVPMEVNFFITSMMSYLKKKSLLWFVSYAALLQDNGIVTS